MRIKHFLKTTAGQKKKVQYITEKYVHSVHALNFYELMKKEIPDSVTICIDLH